jgi:hypothetical protein
MRTATLRDTHSVSCRHVILAFEPGIVGPELFSPVRRVRFVREEADNTIIKHPWEYELVEFCYRRPDDDREPYVDLVLQKGKEKRRLRFFSPRDIQISGSSLPSPSGLSILEIRNRQLEGLGIRVESFEGSNGSPEFWARAVEEIDPGKE